MSTLVESFQTTRVWGGFRVWQRNRDAFVRAWKLEIGGLAIEPFIMLIAVGFGLGSYVQQIDGRSYAEFLAPGVLASYAMFHATFDSTYGSYLRMETHHVYDAMLYTPLEPADIVMGEVMWGATRGAISAMAVLSVATIFGLVGSPMAILAIPFAYLIGLAFGSIAMVVTSTANTIGSINNFFTLFILPMFWASGVFFPLDRLPDIVQKLAWILPLTPAAAMVRGLVSGDLSWWMLAWTAEVAAYFIAALLLASWFMRRRLIK